MATVCELSPSYPEGFYVVRCHLLKCCPKIQGINACWCWALTRGSEQGQVIRGSFWVRQKRARKLRTTDGFFLGVVCEWKESGIAEELVLIKPISSWGDPGPPEYPSSELTLYCSSPWKQKTHTVTVLKERLGSLHCVVKYRLILCQLWTPLCPFISLSLCNSWLYLHNVCRKRGIPLSHHICIPVTVSRSYRGALSIIFSGLSPL